MMGSGHNRVAADPYWGTVATVLECAANLAATVLLGLMLLGKAYYDDSAAKAREADEQRAQAAEAFDAAGEEGVDSPFIIVSRSIDQASAVAAIRLAIAAHSCALTWASIPRSATISIACSASSR